MASTSTPFSKTIAKTVAKAPKVVKSAPKKKEMAGMDDITSQDKKMKNVSGADIVIKNKLAINKANKNAKK